MRETGKRESENDQEKREGVLNPRCSSASYAHEKPEFKTRSVGIWEADVVRFKQHNKTRGSTLQQTPLEFMLALEKTKLVNDIIRQPSGEGEENRLEHRLDNLILEVDEDGEMLQQVKTLHLEKPVFATIKESDGKRSYCLDFPEAKYSSCELRIEVRPATSSSNVRFYVSKEEEPSPAYFDWWSEGNKALTIGPDDPEFEFGKYWITVIALGRDSKFMINCVYKIHRPPVQTWHDKFAEKLLKSGVKERIEMSETRYLYSKCSTKLLNPQMREKFRPHSKNSAGAKAELNTHATRPRLAAIRLPAPASRLESSVTSTQAEQAACHEVKDQTQEERTNDRVDFYEKKYLKSSMERFTIDTRSVSVKNSHFNPSNVRQAIARVHALTTDADNNILKVANGKVDPTDVCTKLMARFLARSIDSSTRSTGLHLSGSTTAEERLNAKFGTDPGYGAGKMRTKEQWAVSTEDPRMRKVIGKQGLPRQLCMLRTDAIDYRTHSFEQGFFQLSRVGALEFTTDVRGQDPVAKDVDYIHIAQIQDLKDVSEVEYPDQPSCMHIFRLQFPDYYFHKKKSKGGKAPGLSLPLEHASNITLAAVSAAERATWIEVLRLFTQLTAEERTNDAKRAELKKLMQEQKARTANQLKEGDLAATLQLKPKSPATPAARDAAAAAAAATLVPAAGSLAAASAAATTEGGGVGGGREGGRSRGGRFLGDSSGVSLSPATAAMDRELREEEANVFVTQSEDARASPYTPLLAADAAAKVFFASPSSLPRVIIRERERERPHSAVPWEGATPSPLKPQARPASALR